MVNVLFCMFCIDITGRAESLEGSENGSSFMSFELMLGEPQALGPCRGKGMATPVLLARAFRALALGCLMCMQVTGAGLPSCPRQHKCPMANLGWARRPGEVSEIGKE